MSAHLDTVQSIYAAFGRGDIAYVLGHLADDVDWRINVDPSLPGADRALFQPRTRPADVAAFFQGLGEFLEMRGMDVRAMATTVDGHGVIVLFSEHYVVRKTGAELHVDTAHHWTFDAHGKVSAWRGYTDTAAELRAALT
ncbi:MAG: nuclear transport factor 2 family protein [Myxococcota bacterium]